MPIADIGHSFDDLVGSGKQPRLSTESSDTLEVGQCITIEPGIYLPGEGGVRIEDLAIVRADGVDVLTSFPKDLIEVG